MARSGQEKLARAKAVRHAWYSFQRFWYQPAPPSYENLGFPRPRVRSGRGWLDYVATSKADTAMVDSSVLVLLVSLRGPAPAIKKGELSQPVTKVSEVGSALPVEHVTRLSDASVWRLVHSVPVNIELQIRRRRRWKS